MSRKVRVAPDAARAQKEAGRWLKQQGSGAEGRRRWNALRTARRTIRVHPYNGVESPEFEGHRRVSAANYRLSYRILPVTGDEQTAGDIDIVAVFGPGQE